MNQFNERMPLPRNMDKKSPGPIRRILGTLFLGIGAIIMASGPWKEDVEFLNKVAQILPQSEFARIAVFAFCLVCFFVLTKLGLDAPPNHPDFPASWGSEGRQNHETKDDKS